MTRRFRSTRKFDKQFKSLDCTLKKQAAKAIELFIEDPSHPSLRFKKVKGTGNFFEISVNMSVRIIIEVTSEDGDQINTFYIIGTHDEVFPLRQNIWMQTHMPKGEALSMRMLHTSDWHLGRIFHNVSLTEDQAYLLDQFVHLAKDVCPEIILISGDIYDRAIPPAEALKLLDEILSRLILDVKAPVILISGNHDSTERLGFGARLLAQQELFLFSQIDKNLSPVVLHDSHGPVYFCPIPYADPPFVKDRLGAQAAEDHSQAMKAIAKHFLAQVPPGARTVALAHAYVLGCQESDSERPLSVGGAGLVDTSCFKPFCYSALGHLHQPQAAGSARIRYAGSLMKYSFSEADQRKSVTLVEMDQDGKVRQEEITLSPMKGVRRQEGYMSDILAGPKPGENREDYLEIILKDTGPILDVMGKLRTVYPNVLNVVRPSLGEGGVMRGIPRDHRRLSEKDLFNSFFAEVTGKPLTDRETKVFVNAANTINREERDVSRETS